MSSDANRLAPGTTAAARALANRQARAWERKDGDLAIADWHAEGVLIAPGARVPVAELCDEIVRFHADHTDLSVDITNVFSDPDGTRMAIEWDWTVTRRRDGVRTRTRDAIIIDLDDGLIRSWREYFDPRSSEVVDEREPGPVDDA